MKLPPELTKVTTISKCLAFILFIILPLIGFQLGIKYEKYYNETLNLQMISVQKYQLNNAIQSVSPSPSPQKAEVFQTLTQIYSTYSSTENPQECHYSQNCFKSELNPDLRMKIAMHYGIINSSDQTSTPINIGLIHGFSVDVTGIGTGYYKNKSILGLTDDKWYWEIGSCATNKRVFLDALSGEQTGPLHSYPYCTKMIEEGIDLERLKHQSQ